MHASFQSGNLIRQSAENKLTDNEKKKKTLKNGYALRHIGTVISLLPFHFHSVSGPHANVVKASVLKEWPSLQDISHSVLPATFRQDFFPLLGLLNSGHSVELKYFAISVVLKTIYHRA